MNITTITEQESSQKGDGDADRRRRAHGELLMGKCGGVITWSGGPGSSYIAEGVGPVTR